jgi:hypothetical protein
MSALDSDYQDCQDEILNTTHEDLLWLLSTTSQSSAALVAIVAGFLLSRVLAIASARAALVQDMASLQVVQDGLLVESRRLHELTFSLGKEFFIEDHQRAFVDARGEVPTELAGTKFLGVSLEESESLAAELAAEVKNYCRILEDFCPDWRQLPRSEDEIGAMSALRAVPNRQLLLAICTSIFNENYAREPKTSLQLAMEMSLNLGDIRSISRLNDVKRLQKLEATVREIDSQIKSNEAALTNLKKQISKSREISGFIPAILLLSAFGLIGIAGPMFASQLTFLDPTIIAWTDLSVFSIFFILFVMFMVNEAYRIKKVRPESQP